MNLKWLLPGRRSIEGCDVCAKCEVGFCTNQTSLSVSWLRRPIWTNDDGPMLTPAISWFKPRAELGERSVRFHPLNFLLRNNFKPTKLFSIFQTWVRKFMSHISESHVCLTFTSFLTNNNLFPKNISYRSII